MDDQKGNWKYTPEDANSEIDQSKEKSNPKSTNFSWKAATGPMDKKKASWYIYLLVITAIIAYLVLILTKDKISTGVVIFCGIVFGIYGARKPREVQYSINDVGLTIGTKEYSFSTFKSFSILDNRDSFTIALTPLKRFMPYIYISFPRSDEGKINGILGQKLPIERTKSDLMERFTRFIRF